MPKTKQKTENPQTARIRQRLEEVKRLAAAAEKEINVPLTESVEAEPVKTAAPVKAANVETVAEQFTLDGANKFTWLLDGEKLTGYVRINDVTATVSDPVVGYTYSMPLTLPFVMNVRGIGRLVSVDGDLLPRVPSKLKLRSGEFVASMAVPVSFPRVVWRTARRSIVWSIIQYQPVKLAWRVVKLGSTPMQTIYELQEIMRAWLGSTYDRLREAIELLATPL